MVACLPEDSWGAGSSVSLVSPVSSVSTVRSAKTSDGESSFSRMSGISGTYDLLLDTSPSVHKSSCEPQEVIRQAGTDFPEVALGSAGYREAFGMAKVKRIERILQRWWSCLSS